MAETPRTPLARDRIVHAAMDMADRGGLDALTMRALGAALGVEAMSLYKHVANKDEILDAMLEEVLGEIEVPGRRSAWRNAMRRRAVSARRALVRHPWAVGLLEERGLTGAAAMRYADAILGCLRTAGFSVDDAAHAFWVIDSYVYGHVVQEIGLSSPRAATPEFSADVYPSLAEAAAHAAATGASIDREFTFGLELILDALASRPGVGT